MEEEKDSGNVTLMDYWRFLRFSTGFCGAFSFIVICLSAAGF